MGAVLWRDEMPGMRTLIRAPDAIRRIQVYGQRCSGTNALIRLIEANLPPGTFTEAYGFKHWFVPPQVLFRADTLIVVIARDPVGWLQSVHRQPWHLDPALHGADFGTFIRAEWASYWLDDFWGVDPAHPVHGTEMLHERDPETGMRFGNAMRKRTAKLAHWAGLHRRAHNLCLIDQRRMQVEPERMIRTLAALTGLPMDAYYPVDSYKGAGVEPYRPFAYPTVDAADMAFIAANLDAETEALYGFALPSSVGQTSSMGADTTTRRPGALSLSSIVPAS